MLTTPLPELTGPVLDLLEKKTAKAGLTLRQIRNQLSKSSPEADLTAEATRDLLHSLWEQGSIAIEPPAQGRREIRFWHARHAPTQLPQATPSVEPSAGEAMKSICGQLATAYHDSDCEDTKKELYRLLFNLGAEPVGKPGQKLAFKGRNHECSDANALPGDPVKVTEPGWMLRNCPGDYQLSKIRVTITS